MIHSENGDIKLDGDIKTLCLDLDMIFKAMRDSFAEPDGNPEGIDTIMMKIFEKSKKPLPKTIIRLNKERD